MTPPFQVLRRGGMGDLGVEMAEIVEIEERVVEMNATEAKTTKMTHKERAEAEKSNATEGAPQAGPW